jgi:hypothetical protein
VQTKPAAEPPEQPASRPEVAPRPAAPAPVPKPPSTPSPKTAPAPGEYKLVVTTSPPGAEIIFDGNPQTRCQSPCTVALSPGRHTLAASLAGHRPELRIFEMTAPRELFLVLAPQTGTLRVESVPAGAQILINGQARPETTPATLTLPVGKYQVEVVKDGSRDQQAIEIKEGALLRVSFQLSQ